MTCEYVFAGGATVPQRVHTLVVSLQHSEKVKILIASVYKYLIQTFHTIKTRDIKDKSIISIQAILHSMEFLCNISSFVLSRVNNFLSPRVISLIKLTHYWTIALLMCPFHGDNFLGYKFIKCHVTLYVINVNISDTYTYRYLQKYISQIPWPMMMTCIIFFNVYLGCIDYIGDPAWRDQREGHQGSDPCTLPRWENRDSHQPLWFVHRWRTTGENTYIT